MILRVDWFGTVASLVLPDGAEPLPVPSRPGLVVSSTGARAADLEVEIAVVGAELQVFFDGEALTAVPSLEAAWMEAWRELELQVAARSSDPVFVHAGAVAIDGHGLVLPGRSGVGKTTLVLHLVEALGATYYSDEYALLDRDAYLHPYVRDPHVRSAPGGRGIPTPIATYTDRVGTEPVRVAGVIVARRVPGENWAPEDREARDCALFLLDNAVGARVRTPAVMDVVGAVAEAAWCVEGARDGVAEVSEWVQTRIAMA